MSKRRISALLCDSGRRPGETTRQPSRGLEPPPASPSEAMPPASRAPRSAFDLVTIRPTCRALKGGLSFCRASRHEAFRVASCRAAPRKARFTVPRPPGPAPRARRSAEKAARPHPRQIARMRCLQVVAAVSSGHTVVGTGIYACGDPHRPGIRPTWVAEAGISAFFVRFKRPIRRLACGSVRNGLATGKSAR